MWTSCEARLRIHAACGRHQNGWFTGGRVSPAGAVIGAMTLTLAGSFLSFLRIPPAWQIGAQGAILILVLALRVLIDRQGRRA